MLTVFASIHALDGRNPCRLCQFQCLESGTRSLSEALERCDSLAVWLLSGGDFRPKHFLANIWSFLPHESTSQSMNRSALQVQPGLAVAWGVAKSSLAANDVERGGRFELGIAWNTGDVLATQTINVHHFLYRGFGHTDFISDDEATMMRINHHSRTCVISSNCCFANWGWQVARPHVDASNMCLKAFKSWFNILRNESDSVVPLQELLRLHLPRNRSWQHQARKNPCESMESDLIGCHLVTLPNHENLAGDFVVSLC